MKTKEILARPAKMLTGGQREFYFEDGYLLVPEFVSGEWLDRLRTVTAQLVEESRAATKSNEKFVLEAGHSASSPRLRRLTSPVEHHPTYWEFASDSAITDVAEDLLGPGVKFHHSKLNFKAEGGGVALQWHQDFPFMPHTNSSVLSRLVSTWRMWTSRWRRWRLWRAATRESHRPQRAPRTRVDG